MAVNRENFENRQPEIIRERSIRVSEMINPVDGWILGHSLVGFFLGRLKFSRHIFYPLTIIWEVYQLYFHYQPQGYSLADVWQNSLVDILAGIGFYEFGVWYSRRERQLIPRIRMNTNTKWMMAHILISCGISWVFWDDMIRREMLTEIPLPQIPLLLGACSPFLASLVVRKWFNCDRFTNIKSIYLSKYQMQ